MKFLRIGILTTSMLFACLYAVGQDSLNAKYQNMIETTETFNQYKVIPRTRIDAFWTEVMDSLRDGSATIKALRQEIAVQIDTISSLSSANTSIQSQLDESLTLNDSIAFVGVNLSKTTYHLIVWGIIVVLAVLAVVVYMMYLKSNRVTVRSNRELETLHSQFEDHKSKARETQVKLKRELQTSINKIEEMKRGRS